MGAGERERDGGRGRKRKGDEKGRRNPFHLREKGGWMAVLATEYENVI